MRMQPGVNGMKNKHILVVDDSAAVQEMCRKVLSEGGHKVEVASNGVAALTYPDLDKIDLIIIDTHLRDVSGIDTTRQIKTDGELFEKPILLLVPEDKASQNESVELMGANAWLLKPFDPATLLTKVNTVLEEQEITRQTREHLQRAAERTITRLAEEHIKQAVEEKTQLMVERALQMVVSQVDRKARTEVESRVTNLTTEKEQELVKSTVQEVARSTIDKLAEKRVVEAMERILASETEKMVRRTADEFFPDLIRERIAESLELLLPREVSRRVQKEAEDLVPDVSQRLVTIINTAAEKVVPKLSRDIVNRQAELTVATELDKNLPRLVQSQVSQEVDRLVAQKMEPHLRENAKALRRRITFFMVVFMLIVGGLAALVAADYMFGPFLQRPSADASTSSRASVVTAGAGDSTTPVVSHTGDDNQTTVPAWLRRIPGLN